MAPLDLSSVRWNDFFTNGVFFLLDILLISLLVPFFVRRYEKRKWAAARSKIGERSALHFQRINNCFEELYLEMKRFAEVFPEAFEGNPDAHTKKGIGRQRQVLFHHLGESVEHLKKDLEKSANEYLEEGRWRNIMSCTALWWGFEAKEDFRWQQRPG